MSGGGDELKTTETSPFTLKSDAAFGSRVGDVFGCLGNIEAKHNAYQKARSSSRNDDDDDDDDGSGLIKDDPPDDFLLGPSTEQKDVLSVSSWKSPSGKQSFKRPRNPAPRSRTCPDHKLNPGKWTYYNLEDVSPDSMSERSNTETATSFLDSVNREQQSKKQKLNPDDAVTSSNADEETSPPKVIFRQPAKKDAVDETKTHPTSEARSGVNVMPEYVIGQKSTTRKSRPGKRLSSSENAASVTISHVMDGDFDDDDDSDDEDLSDSDLSLRARPTRTVFSGCEKEHDDGSKPADAEQSFFSFLSKKSKNTKNKMMRSRRESDSDDNDDTSKLSKEENELDGVD